MTMHWDWGDFMLAIAALMGLLVVVVQFCFELADHGPSDTVQDSHSDQDSPRSYKKAA
ncbi:MAG: hypothetical protein ACREIQ_06235 [Nitrospiria bacterium]